LENSSYNKINAIYQSYVSFFIRMERDSIHDKDFGAKNKIKKHVYLDLLFPKAVATAGVKPCFFGTWESGINIKGKCEHPGNYPRSGYKSNCGVGKFQCNPTFFGGGVCVEVDSQYTNLTNACFKNSGGSLADVKERISGDNFQEVQKTVKRICEVQNNIYDACDLLNTAVKDIAAARDTSPSLNGLVDGLGDTLDNINPVVRKKSCFEFNQVSECPGVLKESLGDMYWNGTVGAINVVDQNVRHFYRYVTNDDTKVSDFRDPRAACSHSEKLTGKEEDITSALQKEFPEDFQLKDFAPGCFSNEEVNEEIENGRKGEDLKLAKAYMQIDFNKKNQRIKKAYKDLLDAHTQIGNLVETDKMNCKDIKNPTSSNYCEKLNACHGKSGNRFQDKLDETSLAFEQIRHLEMLKKDRSQTQQIRAQAQDGINQLLEIYPLLKGKHLARLRSQFSAKGKEIPANVLKTRVQRQLNDSKDKIVQKMKDLDRAQDCLIGQGENCKDFEKIMTSINYGKDYSGGPKDKHLRTANGFYSCVENMKEARNEANAILDDIAIGIALSFTPMVAVNAIKLAATASRTIKAASQSGKLAKNAHLGAFAADMGYSVGMGVSEYNRCSEYERDLKAYDGKELNQCSDIDMKMVSASNVSRCTSQAVLTAALIGGPVAALPVVKFAAKRFKGRKPSSTKPGGPEINGNAVYDNKSNMSTLSAKAQLAYGKIKDRFKGGTKDVLDDFAKEEYLLKQGYSLEQVDAVTRASLVRGDNTKAIQDQVLSAAGFDKKSIKLLRSNGLLNVSDARIERMTTIPKMVNARVRTGGFVSIVGPDGNIINGRVMADLGGGRFKVGYPFGDKNYSKEILADDIYQPIAVGKSVLFEDPKGGISEHVVERVTGRAVKFKDREGLISFSELGLKPRTSNISGARTSEYMSAFKAKDYTDEIERLKTLHPGKDGPVSPQYAEANNRLMLKIQKELKDQGVHASTFKDDDGTISLVFDSVEKGGNNVASLYLRASERFNSQKLTFSLSDNFRQGFMGFNAGDGSRTELGYETVVKMLKGQKNTTALHELRHQMYHSDRVSGKVSMYDIRIRAPEGSSMDLHGGIGEGMTEQFYGKYMSLEELYTHSSDAWNAGKGLARMNMVDRANTIMDMNKKVGGLARLSNNTANLAASIRTTANKDPLSYLSKQQVYGDMMHMSDSAGRTMTMRIPQRSAKLMTGGAYNPENVLGIMNNLDLQEVVRGAANLNPEAKRRVVDLANKLSVHTGKMTPELASQITRDMERFDMLPEFNYITEAVSKNIQTKELIPSLAATLNKVETSSREIGRQALELYTATKGKTIVSREDAADITEAATNLGKLVRGN
jgi:hypothetical protein